MSPSPACQTSLFLLPSFLFLLLLLRQTLFILPADSGSAHNEDLSDKKESYSTGWRDCGPEREKGKKGGGFGGARRNATFEWLIKEWRKMGGESKPSGWKGGRQGGRGEATQSRLQGDCRPFNNTSILTRLTTEIRNEAQLHLRGPANREMHIKTYTCQSHHLYSFKQPDPPPPPPLHSPPPELSVMLWPGLI